MPSETQKRQLAQELLKRTLSERQEDREPFESSGRDYETHTYDMFMRSTGIALSEMRRFSEWVEDATRDGVYGFESARQSAQTTEIESVRETGEPLNLLNFSSYNYLGLGYHPDVIDAAKSALDQFGLGASSSPVISGTFSLHQKFEEELLRFWGRPDCGVSLFSSGYGVNLGTISALIKPGGHVVLDRSAHMSLLEGAELSKGKISYFNHNDADDLERVLSQIQNGRSRILVCIEGIYSADGDCGRLKDLMRVARRYDAYVLVDEAHSMLLAGENGRGVCEQQDVIDQVDFVVMTFSKAFGGVGGAVIARKELTRYINWYARCRMFSCALDPAVTGGMIKSLELATSPLGQERRARLHANAEYFRSLLEPVVDIGPTRSWIVPVHFGDDRKTLRLNDYLQRNGLDTSIMQFPAVPKNEARIRMFVTSEHTHDQMNQAARIIIRAAEEFQFTRKDRESCVD